jgi:hypothetical protein
MSASMAIRAAERRLFVIHALEIAIQIGCEDYGSE